MLLMEAACAVLWFQAAAIHFEKVTRREIGAFTTPKIRSRSKLLAPPTSGKEPERSYSRVPISYSTLDSVGHCFQVNWNRTQTESSFIVPREIKDVQHNAFSPLFRSAGLA